MLRKISLILLVTLSIALNHPVWSLQSGKQPTKKQNATFITLDTKSTSNRNYSQINQPVFSVGNTLQANSSRECRTGRQRQLVSDFYQYNTFNLAPNGAYQRQPTGYQQQLNPYQYQPNQNQNQYYQQPYSPPYNQQPYNQPPYNQPYIAPYQPQYLVPPNIPPSSTTQAPTTSKPNNNNNNNQPIGYMLVDTYHGPRGYTHSRPIAYFGVN